MLVSVLMPIFLLGVLIYSEFLFLGGIFGCPSGLFQGCRTAVEETFM